MISNERLYPVDERLSQTEKDFHFAMQCNGYFLHKDGQWIHDSDPLKSLVDEFKGTRVSFFGPSLGDNFFLGRNVGQVQFVDIFKQKPVTDVIRKYRDVNENLAARIAFIFGGLVRHLAPQGDTGIAKGVNFASRMSMLGEKKSGEGIAAAMAMYIISGGSLEENRQFSGQIFHMSEEMKNDPIIPVETKDLGLSQVARLRPFLDKVQTGQQRPFPDISEYEKAFDSFPIVGAEFHFPSDSPKKYPDFWQRLALLNMSQYQKGSYVQLSRNDRNVIEVRMNPSIYPVIIANWNHMRAILPELNQAFFTITLSRQKEDFAWHNSVGSSSNLFTGALQAKNHDDDLLNKLRTIGMLCYAGMFENKPIIKNREEIDFGGIYLGQTVKLIQGKYQYTGGWNGGEGQSGQLAIYTGFGENLPHLAYYLSMALSNPDILASIHKNFWPYTRTLDHALSLSSTARRSFFEFIRNRIETDGRLKKTSLAGNQIMELLNP